MDTLGMRLLDSLTITYNDQPRTIELYHGDLADMPPEHAVDVLILSAVPESYRRSTRSVIGALGAKGLSVEALAKNKAIDLRANFACWLSNEVPAGLPGIHFKRILCFEPPDRENFPALVGDIFQSLMPFTVGDMPIQRMAISLLASRRSSINLPVPEVLEPLLDAAVHWMRIGLPVTQLKIVEIDPLRAAEAKGAFAVLKKRYQLAAPAAPQKRRYTHDLFVSYAHENSAETQFIVDELRRINPELRVFYDRQSLNTGAAWQQTLFDALDDCAHVLAVYSPAYLASKVCKEEFNIALFRHREEGDTLLPIYLYSTNLPTYMQLIQFTDCREADRAKLREACAALAARL